MKIFLKVKIVVEYEFEANVVYVFSYLNTCWENNGKIVAIKIKCHEFG